MRSLALALILVLAGCSNAAVRVDSGTPVPPARPTSVTTGPGGLQVHGSVDGRVVAALVLMGLIIGASTEASRPTPQLLPGRHIMLQDCTKPLEDTGGNLMCK